MRITEENSTGLGDHRQVGTAVTEPGAGHEASRGSVHETVNYLLDVKPEMLPDQVKIIEQCFIG